MASADKPDKEGVYTYTFHGMPARVAVIRLSYPRLGVPDGLYATAYPVNLAGGFKFYPVADLDEGEWEVL
jgi:hypothetical protein